ncbi:ParB/RepB/Spo0J family partition protein [Mesohalobacter halotolerans]|uniref:ParB/RepB/Spo0J family partition protein n=1 Tax=Mesohalobacter halotolerans TaxID=1883405 RepID=A0A4U5TRE8_9FLAO|nr:ParB/RepB/Spo0J family partition protein [Mesohalobacter halotolerans]MBS3739484.1 ParB/RepB/Spo0J family partition protein [Psychroflexus sp.]TKS56371.1 ParB/RepB/Spo0J family partition protein [Mesohalobacter halotolerans]
MAKAKKKQALGRGLSALLNDPDQDIKSVEDKDADKVVGSIVELELAHIEVNPFQPRSSFNEEHLEELASSIRELGVIQPITVRKIEHQQYQLVSGERRFRASKLAGLQTIPAYIRIANDQEALEMALVENIQRQDLDPIEIALSYQRLIDEIDLTQKQMSSRVGKKRSTITNYLRLLKLDPIIQTGMRDGFISMGHGRALVNIENAKSQTNIYQKILKDKLSVRATEDLVRQHNQKNITPKKTKPKTKKYSTEKQHISKFFGTKVDIKVNQKGNGRIIIPFASEEDLNRIHELLKNQD